MLRCSWSGISHTTYPAFIPLLATHRLKDLRYPIFELLGMKPSDLPDFKDHVKEKGWSKEWLEFVKNCGTEEDYYMSVMEWKEGFEELKKLVSPKTVLRLGSDNLEVFLGAVIPYLGSDQLHLPAEELVQEIQL